VSLPHRSQFGGPSPHPGQYQRRDTVSVSTGQQGAARADARQGPTTSVSMAAAARFPAPMRVRATQSAPHWGVCRGLLTQPGCPSPRAALASQARAPDARRVDCWTGCACSGTSMRLAVTMASGTPGRRPRCGEDMT
jgi:hypothetical protein